MAPSPPNEQSNPSDLQSRVESLERTVADQKQALDDLRAEVQRLRSVVHETAVEEAPDSEQAGTELATSEDGATERDERTASAGEEPSVQERADEPSGSAAPAPSPSARADEEPTADRASESETEEPSPSLLDRLATRASLSSEDWLNYVGIGLLLFGVAFLFKYSVEQGWLVPKVRVGFGGALGITLLVAGLRVYSTRRRLRQVLLGGSSATFYTTVFAAYQLYGLVSYPVAFASMGTVTVATIALAVQQDEPSLAIIGTIGGLGTPFFLPSQVGGVSGFSAYICTVLGGACAIFLARGWRSLLYTTVFGGWGVLLVAAFRAGVVGPRPSDAWALQAGIGVSWGLLAGTPVLRALLRARHPHRWPVSSLPSWASQLVGTDCPAYGLVMASPLLALLGSRLLWDAGPNTWALVAGGGAVLYAGAYGGLRRASLPRYAPVHGLVAAVLAAYGLSEALDGSPLLVAWGVEGLLLLVLARRLDEGRLRVAGHLLFAVLTVGLAGRLASTSPNAAPRLLRPAVLSELVVLGLALAASFRTRRRLLYWTYRSVALVGWLAWWAGELIPVTDGISYALVVWATTAAGLAALAPRLEDGRFLRGATHLIFAVIAGLLAAQFVRADAADLALVSVPALGRLIVLGLALASVRYMQFAALRTVYQNVVLAGWLAWWVSELAPLANGQAYASAVWGATAAALLVGGAWANARSVQFSGLATLGLFVAKLFLVDLASLPALWRIALFLGSGIAFLAISYLLPGFMVGQPKGAGASGGEVSKS
ncbi:MAG: DUF2339 domain-containing protein [Salinibacter sp.]|uniref:DUF2339 domain-containing protein n=1 Tax=Salinibacter sp. TaxID=2065818 RepID=UPI0035D3F19C